MAVVTFTDQRARHGGPPHWSLHHLPGPVADDRAFGGHDRPVILLQIADPLRQRRQRQRIGAQIHLAIAIADRQRAAPARSDHQVMASGKQNRQGEGAVEAGQSGRHRLFGGLLSIELSRQQMRHHLGIGFGGEPHPLFLQFRPQLLEIFYNAVVHESHALGCMRMCIHLSCGAVRGPTRMADADRAGQGGCRNYRLQAGRFCPPLAAARYGHLPKWPHRPNRSRGIRGAAARPAAEAQLPAHLECQ